MITSGYFPLVSGVLLLALAVLDATAFASGVGLAPHRAVYDLRLTRTRGKNAMEAVRGRILYDFTGSACEGYSLQFRQVSELDSGEGKRALSDLRASTWEDAQSKSFRFSSQNFINQRPGEPVDGQAKRSEAEIAVSLQKPKEKSFGLDVGMLFPTQHMRRIIAAAQAGTTIVEVPVFDGSETGEKVYNTLTVIGREIAPNEKTPTDAAGAQQALAGLRRWPVTISYFDRAGAPGEQTPVYAISFELYENGVSRALTLDYGDFVVAGDMSKLDLKEMGGCP